MTTRPVSQSTERARTLSGRRWAIVQEVQHNQQISVAELSRQLGVSEGSIRRDLAHLEGIGLLQRVHGGAQAVLRAGQTAPFDARLLQNVAVKRAIGQAAAALISAGDVVFLDAGTTVLEVARQIPAGLLEGGGLTVVTRSLAIASYLGDKRGVRLIVLGGVYVHDFDTFVGPQVENALRSLHVNKMYVGVDGVTSGLGLTTDNALEAGLYPLMLRSTDRIVIVTDSSKVGASKLQVMFELKDIHTFITDAKVPDGFVESLRAQGIEVMLVP
jgi:DeoR/GlpR family transcriptional regulator of sugar metabolism